MPRFCKTGASIPQKRILVKSRSATPRRATAVDNADLTKAAKYAINAPQWRLRQTEKARERIVIAEALNLAQLALIILVLALLLVEERLAVGRVRA